MRRRHPLLQSVVRGLVWAVVFIGVAWGQAHAQDHGTQAEGKGARTRPGPSRGDPVAAHSFGHSSAESRTIRDLTQIQQGVTTITLMLELENGTVAHLDVLYVYGFIQNGVGALLSAQVTTAAGEVRAPDAAHRWFANPKHHLFDPQYRLTFDDPLGDAYGLFVRGGTIWGQGPPDEYQVCWLDENHDCFRTVLAVKETWTAPELAFLGTGFRGH